MIERHAAQKQRLSRMAPRRIWLFRGIALAFGGLLAFVLAETSVRVWQTRKQTAAKVVLKPDASGKFPGYDTPGRNYESQENFPPMVFDAVTCYRPQPGYAGKGLHINRQGFRHPVDLDEPVPRDVFRVFVVGGSFAFGAGCPDDSTYFRVAETKLREQFPDRKTEIICAAGGAYSSLQEHLTLIARVARYHPNLVIFLTGANDAYFATKGQRVLNGNDYLAYDAAIRGCIDGRILPRYYYGQVFRDPKAPFPPLYDDYGCKVRWLIDKVAYNATAQTSNEVTIDEAGHSNTVEDFLYVQRLNAAWSRSEKVPTVVMLQPTISTVTKAKHPREVEIHASHSDEFHATLQSVYEQMQAGLEAQTETEWVNLNETVSAMPDTEAFFVDWVHAGETGQRVIGAEVAKFIAGYVESLIP